MGKWLFMFVLVGLNGLWVVFVDGVWKYGEDFDGNVWCFVSILLVCGYVFNVVGILFVIV